MSTMKSDEQLEFKQRVHAEMQDNLDEELKMEIDDQRMDELIVDFNCLAFTCSVISCPTDLSFR